MLVSSFKEQEMFNLNKLVVVYVDSDYVGYLDK